MDNNHRLFHCNICKKIYKSYKSLWNHNNIFHKQNLTQNTHCTPKVTQTSTKNNCKYCNKLFSRSDSKLRHERMCPDKKNKEAENNKIELLETKIKELENKIDNKNNKIINTNSNNTTNNNNGVINNIKISFGEEDIDEISSKEKKAILNSGFSSLVKLIEMVHLNKKYPQYQNIKINNLKDKYAKVYDEDKKIFTTISKSESINSLISYRTLDLKSIYKEYHNKDNKLHQCVVKLIDKIESYTPDTDDTKILDFYKNLANELILMIYNKTKEYEIDI